MPYLTTVDKSDSLDIKDISTEFADKIGKEEAIAKTAQLNQELDVLQEYLYAAGTHSVLIVLQGMDTSGKDGTIGHVFESVNPQGCSVTSFKQPTPVEAAHDFLWRAHAAVPANGMMTIFNRSHYEDVLVVRVHNLVPKSVWSKRFNEIQRFEEILVDHNTIILKFFLHISKDEQRKRLLARENDPSKAWKLSAADWHERDFWDDYKEAYNDAIGKTSVKDAPWYIVPADHKWYRNYAIASKLVEVLSKYKPRWESDLKKLGEAKKAELAKMRDEQPSKYDAVEDPLPKKNKKPQKS